VEAEVGSAKTHVWYSNHLEWLVSRLLENLEAWKERSKLRLFNQPPIIVPNRSIQAYLQYALAREAGIAAGLNFHTLDTFPKSLLSRAERGPKLVSRAVLQGFFLDVLSEEYAASHALPEEVRIYLEPGGASADAQDLRRYQLASRLAQLAERYGETRVELLRGWAGEPVQFDAGGLLSGTERWQHALWTRLIERNGIIDRAGKEQGIQWILPWDLWASAGKIAVQLHEIIHIFGFSYRWRGLREMIKRLKQDSVVHLYSVAPFIEFREDLAGDGLKSRASSQFSSRRSGKRNTVAQARNVSPDDLPIIRYWGGPSREFFWMLGEFGDAEFHPGFVVGHQTTLLGQVQREIVQRSSEGDVAREPDESLVILACPGIRREVEIIANEIWRLIDENHGQSHSSSDRLRFPDIAVLLADQVNRQAYQTHFRAVFEDLHGIPCNMVELPLAGECHVIEALLLLLALPLGEFTRPELLKIVMHPAVRARFPETDAGQWRRWCLELEIVHGADKSDHAGTYIDREVFHWEQGLRRLVLGSCMSGPLSGDERVFRLGDQEYVPQDQPADAWASVARLLVLVRSLVADARVARSARWSLSDWSAFFMGWVHAYLMAGSAAEERALSQCLQRIRSLEEMDITGRRHGYRIAYEILRKELTDLTGTKGHYLADGVVVSPLLAMRSLPFRVVFLCGLGEGRFPAPQGADPLDLTLAVRRVGDVRPRERDKYLFLETLVSARERLYLSYVARDAQTGDELEPSPVIHELLRYLHRGRTGMPANFWVKQQPLRRYDDSYFRAGEAGRKREPVSASFSAIAHLEWQARELRRSLRKRLGGSLEYGLERVCTANQPLAKWLGLHPGDVGRVAGAQPERVLVSFRDLRRFLECPLQGWARFQLQLPEHEVEDDAAREDEPFAVDRLQETILLREVFVEALNQDLGSSDPASFASLYDARIQSRTQRGLMPIGVFGAAERHRHLECLGSWHQSTQRRKLLDRGKFAVYRFGRAGEVERVERLESSLLIDVPVTGGANGLQTVRVELFGRTEIVSRTLPASITPVIRKTAGLKDFLAGFLDAVILSMLPGHHDPAEYHAHVLTNGVDHEPSGHQVTFRGIDERQARAFLTTVLADLLSGPHSYLLPCEAVFDYLGEKKKPIRSSIEWMKVSDREPCSSRHGPVPDFARYNPPVEEVAREMIERRFGLFRDSGGVSG
jgi:exodeoxyribonuclease V gamma subunit